MVLLTAVIVWLPTVSAAVEMLAVDWLPTPAVKGTAAPPGSTTPLSLNVTVPVAESVGKQVGQVKVAIKVTICPCVLGLGEPVTIVELLAVACASSTAPNRASASSRMAPAMRSALKRRPTCAFRTIFRFMSTLPHPQPPNRRHRRVDAPAIPTGHSNKTPDCVKTKLLQTPCHCKLHVKNSSGREKWSTDDSRATPVRHQITKNPCVASRRSCSTRPYSQSR